jgi:hypothetical protein
VGELLSKRFLGLLTMLVRQAKQRFSMPTSGTVPSIIPIKRLAGYMANSQQRSIKQSPS